MFFYFLFYLFLIFILCGTLLLFAPFIFEINTKSNLYRFQIIPIFKIWWETGNIPGHIMIKIFGITKKIHVNNLLQKISYRKTGIKKNRPSKFKFTSSQVISVIKSFKIKILFIELDTGDVVLNGLLYPIIYLLRIKTGKKIQINYFGKNEIKLTVKNNTFRVLKALIYNR